MRKLICFLIPFILNFEAFSQKDSTNNHFLYRGTFDLYKDVFNKNDYQFKVVKFDTKKIFPVTSNSKTNIFISIDSLQKSAHLKVETSKISGSRLYFNAKFPNQFKEDKLVDVSILKIIECNLFTLDNRLIDASESSGGYSRGSESENHYGNDETKESINRILVSRVNGLKGVNTGDSIFVGSVLYEMSFLSNYSKVTLSKDDISKKFIVNDNEYLLVDILNNKIVLETVNLRHNLNFLNLDKDGNVLENYSGYELYKMKEKDESINVDGAFSIKNYVVRKELYNFFKSNPDISLEEYKKKISVERIREMSKMGEYLILETVAPIENNFILYEPVYGISKIFEVKY